SAARRRPVSAHMRLSCTACAKRGMRGPSLVNSCPTGAELTGAAAREIHLRRDHLLSGSAPPIRGRPYDQAAARVPAFEGNEVLLSCVLRGESSSLIPVVSGLGCWRGASQPAAGRRRPARRHKSFGLEPRESMG